MRRMTKKLSGPPLDRYLRRFFAEEPGLPTETARTLAARAGATFSSLRVRAMPAAASSPPPDSGLDASARAPWVAQRQAAGMPDAVPTPAPSRTEPTPSAVSEGAAAAFDPYVIGLVPTFQREGREGLVAKLAAITTLDNLRKMARAQQVVLPEGMRQGDVLAETLRTAIADAVAKRIADRKAAAS